jgi:hypothetical protein
MQKAGSWPQGRSSKIADPPRDEIHLGTTRREAITLAGSDVYITLHFTSRYLIITKIPSHGLRAPIMMKR